MLSDLQRQVAELITGLPGAEGFALAGGAALIVRGDVVRRTRDLDFFGLEPDRVNILVPVAVKAMTEVGLDVNVVRQADGFARLEVRSGAERTEVDFAADARLFLWSAVPWPDAGRRVCQEVCVRDGGHAIHDGAKERAL